MTKKRPPFRRATAAEKVAFKEAIKALETGKGSFLPKTPFKPNKPRSGLPSAILGYLKGAVQHVKEWRETYGGFVFSLLILWGFLHFYHFLTGRQSIDQPDSLVGYALNAIGIVFACALVGFMQSALFGYVHRRLPNKLCSFAIDITTGLVLLVIFLHYIFSADS